jgi:hypothetical protein
MRAVDTNVLVRLITWDDAKQPARADRFVSSGAWVSHLVLVETTWVLSAVHALDAASIARALDASQSRGTVDPGSGRRARRAGAFSPEAGAGIFRLPDSGGRSRRGACSDGTFDRDLGKLVGAQRL